MGKDEYVSFAEIYDLFYHREEDIDFYSKLAETYGDPVLELGCGTGRVLLNLAKRGYRVYGLDTSESMLNVLSKKIKNENLEGHVKYAVGDMRNFKLDEKFNLIIIPFSTITHNTSLDDLINTFKCVREHLNKGGALAFDLFVPKFEYLAEGSRNIFDIREKNGAKMVVIENAKYDLTNHLIHVKRYVRVIGSPFEGEYTWFFTIRFWFKGEIELALRLAGFNKVNVYGGFNYEEYSYDRGIMVFIAEK